VTFDGRIAVPDGWSYVPVPACAFDDVAQAVHSWADYSRVVSARVTEAHRGLFHHSTHSQWYQAVTEATVDRSAVLVRQTARCASYAVARDIFAAGRGAPLDPHFAARVAALPTDPAQAGANDTLLAFVQEFGNAVVDWALFGGKTVELTEFDSNSYAWLRQEQGDLSRAAAVSMLCSLGDTVLCDPSNPHYAAAMAFRNASSQRHRAYIPTLITDPALGYGAAAWAAAVQANPDVIEYRLRPLSELLTSAHFPADQSIVSRRAALDAFLNTTYCQLLPHGCPTPPPDVARWATSPAAALPEPRAYMAAAPLGAMASAFNYSVLLIGDVAAGSSSNSSSSRSYARGARKSRVNSAAPSPAPLRFTSLDGGRFTYAPSPSLANAAAGAGAPMAAAAVQLLDGSGDVVVTGGFDGSGATAFVTRFRAGLGIWQNVAPLLTARYTHCAVYVASTLLVLGGTDGKNSVADIEAYDALENRWEVRMPLPDPRERMACTAIGDRFIYVTGGINSTGQIAADVAVYDALHDVWITDPAQLPPPMRAETQPRYGHVQALIGDNLFVIGGLNDTDQNAPALNDVHILQISQGQWLRVCPMLAPVAFASGWVLNGSATYGPAGVELHVFGGIAFAGGPPTAEHQVLYIPPNATLTCASSSAERQGRPAARTAASAAQQASAVELTRRSTRIQIQTAADRRFADADTASPVHPAASFLGAGLSTLTGELTAARLFDPTCASCFSSNASVAGWRVPDGVSVGSFRQCSYHASALTTTTASEAALQAAAFFDVDVNVDFAFLFDASFSASASASVNLHSASYLLQSSVHATASCTAFSLGHDGLWRQNASDAPGKPTLDPGFVQAVLSAPAVFDPEHPEPHLDILLHYGDAYVVALDYGARATQSFRLTQANYSAALSAGVDVSEAASRSFLGFWGSSRSQSASDVTRAAVAFSQYVDNNTTACAPICPPAVFNGTINSTAWYHAVAPELGGQGAPIHYTLRPMAELLQPALFPQNTSAAFLGAVADILRQLSSNGTLCRALPGCSSPLPSPAPAWNAANTSSASAGFEPFPCPSAGCLAGTALYAQGGLLIASGGGAARSPALLQSLAYLNRSCLPQAPWNYRPPSLQAQSGATALPLPQGAVAFVGGVNSSSQPTGAVQVFNVTTHSWIDDSPPSLPQAGLGAPALTVLSDGALLALDSTAAYPEDQCVARLRKPGASSWSSGAPTWLPGACLSHAAALVLSGDADVLLFGGTFANGSCSSSVAHYALTTDIFSPSWLSLPHVTCTPRIFSLNDTRAVLVDEDGRVFRLRLDHGDFEVLPSAPEAPLNRSSVAYDASRDELIIMAASRFYVLAHVSGAPVPRNSGGGRARAGATGLLTLPSPPPSSSSSVTRRALLASRPARAAKRVQDESQQLFPSVDALFHGYHTLYGDPFSPRGVDGGWRRQAIFEAPSANASAWTTTMDVPGDVAEWLLPSGVDGTGYPESESCNYFDEAYRLSDSWQLREALQETFPIAHRRYGFPLLFGAEFSASVFAHELAHVTSQAESELVLALGHCQRYALSWQDAAAPFNFTSAFVADLRALPQNATDPLRNDAALFNFTERYGLTAPTGIRLGAVLARASALRRNELDVLLQAGFDVTAGAEANLLFVLGADASAGGGADAAADASFRQAVSQNYTLCFPACPPVGPDVASSGVRWQQTLIEANGTGMQPIGMDLKALPDVIDASRKLLPLDMQGPALDNRLQTLSTFIEQRLCALVPGCRNATTRPSFGAATPSKLPQAVRNAAAFVSDAAFTVAGGETSDGIASATNAVQTFEFASQEWATRYYLNAPRSCAAGTVAPNGDLWLCGGANSSSGALAVCEVAAKSGAAAWEYAAALTTPRQRHVMFELGGSLFVVGGQLANGTQLASIESLDLTADRGKGTVGGAQWTPLPPASGLPMPAADLGFVVLPSRAAVLLVGSLSVDAISGNTVLGTNIWLFDGQKVVPVGDLALPLPRAGLSVALLTNDTVLAFGGQGQAADGSVYAATEAFEIDLAAVEIRFSTPSPWPLVGASLVALPPPSAKGAGGVKTGGGGMVQRFLLAGGDRTAGSGGRSAWQALGDGSAPSANITLLSYTMPLV
jgi:N-acetylneuraminic acid mutarotase